MKRREFHFIMLSGAGLLLSGCDKAGRILTSAVDGALEDVGNLQMPDIVLSGNRRNDVKLATSRKVQDKIRRIANGSGEELIIVFLKDGSWETITIGTASAGVGGVDYAHPWFRINNLNAVHASLGWAGGIVGLFETIALQFRDKKGELIEKNGIAMSWSIFSGKQVAKLAQEGADDSMFNNILKLFGVALGALLAVTAGKWILGLIAFLLGQLIMFAAAAAAVGVIVAVLDLIGFDLLTKQGREEFVQFLKDLFDRLIRVAMVTFENAERFFDSINLLEWPPQIPESAFD